MKSTLFVVLIVEHLMCLPPMTEAGFCSPFTKENIIQFCSGKDLDGTDIYIDSFDVLTRKTNCTCDFRGNTTGPITLTTRKNPVNSNTKCNSSRIEYQILEDKRTSGTFCDYIGTSIDISDGQTLRITFYNRLVNLEEYCLYLSTASDILQGKCLTDGSVTDGTTQSVTTSETRTTTRQRINKAYTGTYASTELTGKYDNKDTTTGGLHVTPLQDTSSHNGELPLTVLLPSVIGGLIFIIIVIVIIVICVRRNKNSRQILKDTNIRRNSDSGDEMVYNELYHSRNVNNNVGFTTGDAGIGEYADVSDPATEATNKKTHNEHGGDVGEYAEVSSHPTTSTRNANSSNVDYSEQKQESGPVYATPNKARKQDNEQEDTTPVYAVPDKKRDK